MTDGDSLPVRVGRVEMELSELRTEMRKSFDELRTVLLGDFRNSGGWAARSLQTNVQFNHVGIFRIH